MLFIARRKVFRSCSAYDTGNEIQKEIGSRAYQDALALPELSLQDIEAKLAALESACALLKLKKEEDVSEDEIKELEDKVQKLTDKYIKDVDAAVEAKGKEIMTV